jgi:hypothetical protein
MESFKPVDISKISPERRRIAKIFQTHIEKAIAEIGIDLNTCFIS